MREVTAMTKNAVRLAAMSVALAGASAQAAVVLKANNTVNLDQASSWLDVLSAPGSGDIATWDSTYTQTASLTLGSDLAWSGINFVGVPNGFTFNGGSTLTLGANGITTNINKNYTFNNAFALSAAQTWSIGNGITNFGTGSSGIDTNGNSLTFAGAGQKIIKTAITEGGALYFLGGTSKLTSGAVATASAATVGTGASLNFDVNTGTLVRLSSVTLEGRNSVATLSQNGSTGNQVDQISGALTIAPGAAVVTITSGAGGARIEAGSLARQAGSNVLFRGSSFGSAVGSNVGNVMFSSAPALAGSGSSGNTIGIIKGAIGDTTTGGSGYSTTGGLVTYDAATGVRLLAGSEYQSGMTAGQGYETTPIHVNSLVENASGLVNTIQLGSDTALNSLSLRVSAANSGITITGDGTTTGTLKITSGVVYAVQSVGSATANAMNIETPVDFDGQEGVILASTSGIANSVTAGRLEFKNAITNSNGLTKAGPGEVRFSGSAANTYSGITTVNEGILTLVKSSGTNAIGGDLVINGGRVQHASSNQIPNTANITINGGTYSLQYSNSGSVFRESFNNLTMNGGSYVTGTAGHDGETNILGTMTLAAGAINMSSSDDITVTGLATYSGGTHTISPASNATYNTVVTFNGGLAITNTASGAYTPLTLSASATNKGAKLVLGSNLTFAGNSTNANTVTIDAGVNTNLGVIDLGGSARTFNIGDGAADADLTVKAVIDNGGITKTGVGTLVLAGANSYSGGTTVSAGRLLVSGSLGNGAVSVAGDAILGGSGGSIGGTVSASGTSGHLAIIAPGASVGTLTVANAVTFGDYSGLSIELVDDAVDLLAATSLDLGSSLDSLTINASGVQALNRYVFATYNPANPLGGTTFNNWTINGLSGASIDYSTAGEIAVVIPEPTALTMLLTMGAGVMALRRRRGV